MFYRSCSRANGPAATCHLDLAVRNSALQHQKNEEKGTNPG